MLLAAWTASRLSAKHGVFPIANRPAHDPCIHAGAPYSSSCLGGCPDCMLCLLEYLLGAASVAADTSTRHAKTFQERVDMLETTGPLDIALYHRHHRAKRRTAVSGLCRRRSCRFRCVLSRLKAGCFAMCSKNPLLLALVCFFETLRCPNR